MRLTPRSIMQLANKLHFTVFIVETVIIVHVTSEHKPPSIMQLPSSIVVVTYGHKLPFTVHDLHRRHYLRHRHLRAQTALLGTTCMLVQGDSNLPPLPLH